MGKSAPSWSAAQRTVARSLFVLSATFVAFVGCGVEEEMTSEEQEEALDFLPARPLPLPGGVVRPKPPRFPGVPGNDNGVPVPPPSPGGGGPAPAPVPIPGGGGGGGKDGPGKSRCMDAARNGGAEWLFYCAFEHPGPTWQCESAQWENETYRQGLCHRYWDWEKA